MRLSPRAAATRAPARGTAVARLAAVTHIPRAAAATRAPSPGWRLLLYQSTPPSGAVRTVVAALNSEGGREARPG